MAAIWSPCDPPQVEYDPVAEAAEEDFQGDVQARIDALRPIDLADMVIDGDEVTNAVDLAARRILGRAIRAAQAARTYSSAVLSDDELTLVAFVRETVEAEVRNG